MQNSNSEGKASPGQPFSAPKAEIWNSMIDAGNAHRNGRLSNGTPEPTRPRQTDIIKLKNSSGASRSRGEILRINGKAITNLTDEHIWLIGSAPTDDGYFGILKEPIANGSIGQVQVSGCCMATVDIADADHTRAKAVASQYVLESSDDGPIEIVYKPSGTGELECVVRFQGPQPEITGIVIMTPTAGIPPRVGTSLGVASCEVYAITTGNELVPTGNSVVVLNMTATPVEGDAYGQAKRVSGRWVIDVEECEVDEPSSSVVP
jgi:hypothetical protein